MNQAETTIAGVDDQEEFQMADVCLTNNMTQLRIYKKKFQEAFDILMFSKAEKFDVFRICSAIVHMGDMTFKQRGEQAEPDGKDGKSEENIT